VRRVRSSILVRLVPIDGFLTDICFTVVSPENQSAVASGRLAPGLPPDAADLLVNWQVVLGTGETNRPFATAEKLAELGVREIARRLEGNESLADIMTEIARSG
jgi:hypothetical protein